MHRDNPFEGIEDFLESMGMEFEMESTIGGSIPVDVRETEDSLVVTADLPGIGKDDIEVTLADRTLSIHAEYGSESETESEDGQYVRRERHHTEVSRSVSLPEGVDEEGIEASHSNGVLTVTLPKRTVESGTEIDIE